jgi:hypothetical protein
MHRVFAINPRSRRRETETRRNREEVMKILNGLRAALVCSVFCLGAAGFASADDVAGDEQLPVPAAEAEEEESGGWMSDAMDIGSQFVESVYIHAFGEEAWGWTNNENDYLVGKSGGKWDNLAGGIVIGGRPHERLRIHSQVIFENKDVSLDFLFGEVMIVDEFKIQGGAFPASLRSLFGDPPRRYAASPL